MAAKKRSGLDHGHSDRGGRGLDSALGVEKPLELFKGFGEQASLMRLHYSSINDLPIAMADRKSQWPRGPRPDNHPGLELEKAEADPRPDNSDRLCHKIMAGLGT